MQSLYYSFQVRAHLFVGYFSYIWNVIHLQWKLLNSIFFLLITRKFCFFWSSMSNLQSPAANIGRTIHICNSCSCSGNLRLNNLWKLASVSPGKFHSLLFPLNWMLHSRKKYFFNHFSKSENLNNWCIWGWIINRSYRVPTINRVGCSPRKACHGRKLSDSCRAMKLMDTKVGGLIGNLYSMLLLREYFLAILCFIIRI